MLGLWAVKGRFGDFNLNLLVNIVICLDKSLFKYRFIHLGVVLCKKDLRPVSHLKQHNKQFGAQMG